MKGQGLVEYGLILIMVAIVAIVVLALFTGGENNPCFLAEKQ